MNSSTIPLIACWQLHPFCQQRPIVDYCREHSIVVQAYCPIMRGKMDHPIIQTIAQNVSPASKALYQIWLKGLLSMVATQPKCSFGGRFKKGLAPSFHFSTWIHISLGSFRCPNQQRQNASDRTLNYTILNWNPKRWSNLTDLTVEKRGPSAGTLLMLRNY